MDSQVHVSHIAFGTTVHELKLALAGILHAPPFLTSPRPKFNFEVQLIPQRRNGPWQIASLTLPTVQIAENFLYWYGSSTPRYSLRLGTMRIRFQKSHKNARREVLERIRRLPYEDPREAQAREERASQLDNSLIHVSTIQFGWECRDDVYSVEWERPCLAYLTFDGTRREFLVKMPDVVDSSVTRRIVIRASQITWVSASVQQPSGQPNIFFSLSYPPSFESEPLFAPMMTTHQNGGPHRKRWSSFDQDHEPIAPYTSLAIRLECESSRDLDTFRSCARAAHVPVGNYSYATEWRGLFSRTWRDEYALWVSGLPWLVAFHVEALLRLWLVDISEVLSLREPIDKILRERPPGYTVEKQREYIAALLRDFTGQAKLLHWYGGGSQPNSDGMQTQPRRETIAELFARVRAQFVYKPLDTFLTAEDPSAPFNCLHLTVTPSTMILEGPYPERSNRVMRTYYQNQDSFLRVSFQDENRLQFRFDRELDGRDFVNRRVRDVLLEGITIAGAHFDFLAYSQSALKEHAVWFVKPFRYKDADGLIHFENAETIIASLGKFRNLSFDPTLIYCPARYAARISQAFTATDASISMEVGQIMRAEDVKDVSGKYAFTDGVGTVSPALAKEIWKALREKRRRGRHNRTYPRAYQIRFQGSKGMLSVDYTLPGNAIVLRPSMIKFEDPESLIIEVARAFDRPGPYYLNRPLIMLLEGLGVPYEAFEKLQDDAVHDAQQAVKSLERSGRLLEAHGLGASFRLTSAMLGLHKLGLSPLHQDIFWRQMMDFGVNHVLRELKHHARIPVPGADSWTLVGVADVHGYLADGEVFVCVDSPNESGLIYLEGRTLVSRSPTIHPGDVQIVNAIGRPPLGSPFARESLRNTIVFSIKGERPLPSCLGGGDLDGDVYNVTTRRDLLPMRTYYPASYEPAPKKLVDHESTMADVAEFVAEYIHSDTLGIIASTWLIIADQSEKGILDPDCVTLAQLHSDAVDYPKSGQPVPVEHIPRLQFKGKPDWNAPEVISRDNTSYYESKRAIGRLFRAIKLPALREVERAVRFQRRHMRDDDQDEPFAKVLGQFYEYEPEDNEVLETVQERVSEFVPTDVYDDDIIIHLWELYNTYVSQMRVICADYTLSHQRSAMLTEEEAVVGTIVAKCTQPRKRRDLMSQMREQTDTLVKVVKDGIAGDEDVPSETSLQRAWLAYRLAAMEGDNFGARSFGWVALGNIFDAIREIEEEERTLSRRG